MFKAALSESRTGDLFAYIEDEIGPVKVPLKITARLPLRKIPLLLEDPSGRVDQETLDALMEFRVRGLVSDEGTDILWWFEYYKERRADQEKYASIIEVNTAAFRREADEDSRKDQWDHRQYGQVEAAS